MYWIRIDVTVQVNTLSTVSDYYSFNKPDILFIGIHMAHIDIWVWVYVSYDYFLSWRLREREREIILDI